MLLCFIKNKNAFWWVQTQSVAMVWPVICYKWCHLYWGSRPKVLQWCDLSFVTSGVTCTGGPDPKCCNGVTCHLLQVVSLVLGVQTQSVAMVWPVICYKWCHLYWGSRPKVLQWCDLSFVTSGVTCTGGPDPKCCNGVTCHLLQVVSLVLGVQSQSVAIVWPVICYKWCHLYWGSSPKVLLCFICILPSPDPKYWNGVTCYFTFIVVLFQLYWRVQSQSALSKGNIQCRHRRGQHHSMCCKLNVSFKSNIVFM